MLILFVVSLNIRVEQNVSLYTGACKYSQVLPPTEEHSTYCDCTSDTRTCVPGSDVVNCVSSSSIGEGRQLPAICSCSFSQTIYPVNVVLLFALILIVYEVVKSLLQHLHCKIFEQVWICYGKMFRIRSHRT